MAASSRRRRRTRSSSSVCCRRQRSPRRALPDRAVTALRAQQQRRHSAIASGARRVGWKIGRGIVPGEEHLEPVIGYLTSDTVLEAGGAFDARGTKDLRVDAELAVEVGADGGAAGYGAALELVDVARPPYDFESIVAGNIWHRGVAFGPLLPTRPRRSFEACVLVDGEIAGATTAEVDAEETVSIAANLLEAVGEALLAGDRIICGSLVHVRVQPGDNVAVDLGLVGRVGVQIQ